MAILTAKEMAERKGSSGKTGEPVRVEVPPLLVQRVSRIRDIPNPAPVPRYLMMHPDATTESGLFDCEVTVGDKKLPMKRGRIETDDEEICKRLIVMGYRWMNEPF